MTIPTTEKASAIRRRIKLLQMDYADLGAEINELCNLYADDYAEYMALWDMLEDFDPMQ